jgi:hypothetical protein
MMAPVTASGHGAGHRDATGSGHSESKSVCPTRSHSVTGTVTVTAPRRFHWSLQAVTPSGFLPTYDIVGIPTMSYLPDVAYDVVGQDLRCRMCTTSYVMTRTYDIDIRHRTCPT